MHTTMSCVVRAQIRKCEFGHFETTELSDFTCWYQRQSPFADVCFIHTLYNTSQHKLSRIQTHINLGGGAYPNR